jgi:hypothetical protein
VGVRYWSEEDHVEDADYRDGGTDAEGQNANRRDR